MRNELRWYKVNATICHQGAGSRSSTRQGSLYVFSNGIISVLNTYKRIPGVTRNKVPEIFPLSVEDSLALEKKIVSDSKISLEQAKRRYYLDFNF